MVAKEVYICDGNLVDSKYVLCVMLNGDISLVWYSGTLRIEQYDPIVIKKENKKMVIEYGTPNLFGIRPNLEFFDKDGNLEKKWSRIK